MAIIKFNAWPMMANIERSCRQRVGLCGASGEWRIAVASSCVPACVLVVGAFRIDRCRDGSTFRRYNSEGSVRAQGR